MDYSKWDKLEVSDDEEDSPAIVTQFDKPQQVTFGGGVRSGISGGALNENSAASESERSQTVVVSKEGGTLDETQLTKNGGSCDRYYWSQSSDEVTAYIYVPLETRGRDFKISIEKGQGLPDAKWRESGNILSIKGKEFSLEEELSHPVLSQDEFILWELKTLNDQSADPKRFIVLNLTKNMPIQGATIWWDCFLKGDPSIDVALIGDRKNTKKSSEFGKVWKEAHAKFRERRLES